MVRPGLFVAAVLVAFFAGCSGNDIPAETLAVLQHADSYELLSLDPSRETDPPPDHFHGWRVLGRAMITDPTKREKLNSALRAGAKENSNTAAGCFNPRHGIRAVSDGKAFDIVICFECLQAQVFEDGQRGEGFLVSDSPQTTFDDVLRAAGVPLAEKAE